MTNIKTVDTAKMKGSKKLLWVARIVTVTPIVVAIIYSLVLNFVIIRPGDVAPGALTGGALLLSPIFLGIAAIAWVWSLAGGLLVFTTGILAFNGVLYTNYGIAVYEALYSALCLLFTLGGILHVIRAFIARIEARAEK